LTPCCKSAGAISSVPDNLNGLNVLIAHLILDWSVTLLDHKLKVADSSQYCRVTFFVNGSRQVKSSWWLNIVREKEFCIL
jgi:hypothetical protein